jgi:hypothetical protein
MHDESKPRKPILDVNLITSCSNILKVYIVNDRSITLRVTSTFNDRIIDIIRVPTSTAKDFKAPFAPKKSAKPAKTSRGRRSIEEEDMEQDIQETQAVRQDESTADYIFVLTQSFQCALLAYNSERNRIEVVSKGNFSEKPSVERKEPPYPTFLAEDNSFIALMLFENIIKIIPFIPGEGDYRLQLTNAVNLRIRHSDVSAVIPLHNTFDVNPTFGVLYQKIEHVQVNGKPC